MGIVTNHVVDQAVIEKYRKVYTPFLTQPSTSSLRIQRRAGINSGLEPYSGTWGKEEVAHLLRRTLFGVRKVELDQFSAMTMLEAVNTLLQPEAAPSPPVNDYNQSEYNVEGLDPDVPSGETWVSAPRSDTIEGLRIYSLKGWIINQFLTQPPSIHQKLKLFWHNLLPTQIWGVFHSKSSYQYWDMLHENSFGNFKSLIRKLTLDPSMLLYLNGAFNNKDAPDENYARELQELFCIGKGPNANFTEGDVQAAARVLTGWTINADGFHGTGQVESMFYAPFHDYSDKTFSSFYGNTIISGSGEGELDELLDMIFLNNETAHYICRRLYNFFVYHQIDDITETNVIEPMAQIFQENNYEITPVLTALFQSEHFFDPANFGASIKSPVDHTIGLYRSFDIPQDHFGDASFDSVLKRNMLLLWNMSEKGMEVGDPPSVAGWQAYYQSPSFDRFWVTTHTIISRASSQADFIFNGGLWGYYFDQFSLIDLVQQLDNPASAQDLVRGATELLFGLPLAEETVYNMSTIINPVEGQWAVEWYQFLDDTSDETQKNLIESRLKSMFHALLQQGEFQLM